MPARKSMTRLRGLLPGLRTGPEAKNFTAELTPVWICK
jgi:hypothetical protein